MTMVGDVPARLDQAKSTRISQACADIAIAEHYFRLVAPEDVIDRSTQDLHGVISSHLKLAARRDADTTLVHVITPSQGHHSWIQIVTDDMPFLVDSVTAELVRLGHQIRLIIHPQFNVHRDDQGALTSFVDSDVDGTHESWMSFEVAKITGEANVQETIDNIRRVLGDVKLVDTDAPVMAARARQLAQKIASQSPVLAGAHDAADLLNWLADEHFTFIGYREYDLTGTPGQESLSARHNTGMGVLRHDTGRGRELTPQARAIVRQTKALVLTKANRRSTVQRPAYLDYVGVKDVDAQGQVVGELRFIGLYAQSAYTQSVWAIPVIRQKCEAVLESLGLERTSHSGKDLVAFLETYPRDELFQIDVEELLPIAQAVLHLQERRQTRLFLRNDHYGRFVSALVYLPRDRYTTDVRLAMEDILRHTFSAVSVDTTAHVSESVLARLHFVVRVASGSALPAVNHDALEAELAHATRSWADDFADAMDDSVGEDLAVRMTRTWSKAFPPSYMADFTPAEAVAHAQRFEALSEDSIDVQLYVPSNTHDVNRRFAIFRRGPAMSLSELLPILQNLGVEVIDERPYDISPATLTGAECHIYDFGLRVPPEVPAEATLPARFAEAFISEWHGKTANHKMNALVTLAGLDIRQATILRAYSRYLRQSSLTYSLGYIEGQLIAHPEVTRLLISMFERKFDPAVANKSEVATANAALEEALNNVPSLDADRILRSFAQLIAATLRTNAYVRGADGQLLRYQSFKIAAHTLDSLLPAPRPKFEVWVHSPDVEGVHLRFGAVARGGLRWSDRPDDFRTEILGLVKAQMVKNAVIVPVGAKGGFVVQRLVDSSDRDAWMSQGIECYRTFIRGLLDITDNLVAGVVVPPKNVVRHDGDDPYLVVAADKGTASFSDHANAISLEYKFWLGDAFASGGSAGYDHKAMGITARGAWESVKRHFRELGLDTQSTDFTAVGIGDMSGDVFGNGMLLSHHIRLVAAFDHRHVFLDPNPDSAASFAERKRLFELPRSSWADYNPDLISAGGGVFSRTQKSIPVSPEVAQRLGIEGTEAMSPNELIRAVLMAPVDLLWNGGIGTYVKSSNQSHSDVGDKSNDAIRINGSDLRVRVVGEGGNLGFTQLGRIEAALNGIRLNTDAIDNSAGVDTSDHEVNIKILMQGTMPLAERNTLLAEMTSDVAAAVLRDNYEQNVVLANARTQSADLIPVHRRMLLEWESQGFIDRVVENLPSDEAMAARESAGKGLVSPELAVMLAYSKITLLDDLLGEGIAEEPAFHNLLVGYFPSVLSDRLSVYIDSHPLRKEIITTVLVNKIVNQGGISFVFRAMEETGATAVDVARAFTVSSDVFSLEQMRRRIEVLDGQVPTSTQSQLYLEVRRLLDRSVRWLLSSGSDIDVQARIGELKPVVDAVRERVPSMLLHEEAARWRARRDELIAAGAPEDLAADCAALLDVFSLLDIAQISSIDQAPSATELYFALSARFNIDSLLLRITALPRGDRWDALARGAMRADLYSLLRSLTKAVLESTDSTKSAGQRIDQWESLNQAALGRARHTLAGLSNAADWDIATISVALRTLRTLVS